jgi:glycosyltransferase involved in cell wall biosynthesis
MIRIVQIQIFTQYTGRAALRLHKAFLKAGIDSNIITLRPAQNDDEKIKQKGKLANLIARLDHMVMPYIIRNTIKKFGPFSYPRLGSNISNMVDVKNADFIYIHWALGGFLNFSNFEQLAKLGKPVVFFMHDMWNITGGCHHSFTCEKYKSHCQDCQIFSKHTRKDFSYKGFEKKKKLYSKYNNLYFVSPSKWLYNCSKQSALTIDKPIFHIPNYIDTTFFKPIDKNIAKRIFNINPNNNVIAFGAISIDNPYKGWDYLTAGLKILSSQPNIKNIVVLIFGSGYKKEIDSEIPFETIFTGHLSDEYSTMLVYNAADVFIAPSIADNLPTTILESLSCGTPVVGFDVGGIPDMIRHRENGYLAKYRNSNDISEGIKFCLDNKIKGYILPEFNPKIILDQHFDLLNQIRSPNTWE